MKNALRSTALVVLALCVGAWLAVGYRNAKLEAKGERVVADMRHGPITPQRAREGLDALDDAGVLSTDQAPNLTEGNLRLFLGQRARAVALAHQVTADEPDNANGWFLAYLAERGPAKRAALERLKALDPWAGDVLASR
jgi:hypothetical protein